MSKTLACAHGQVGTNRAGGRGANRRRELARAHQVAAAVTAIVFLLTGAAAQGSNAQDQKQPTWTGRIDASWPTSVGHHAPELGPKSLSVQWFLRNGCNWAGRPDMNGRDGIVFDLVEKTFLRARKASVAWAPSIPPPPYAFHYMTVNFWTSGCEHIDKFDSTWYFVDPYDAVVGVFPRGATWASVAASPTGLWGAYDIDVEIRLCLRRNG